MREREREREKKREREREEKGEEREGLETRYNLQRHVPLFAVVRTHLLKFLPLFKIVLPAEDQACNI
jgi:hypothetical protein